MHSLNKSAKLFLALSSHWWWFCSLSSATVFRFFDGWLNNTSNLLTWPWASGKLLFFLTFNRPNNQSGKNTLQINEWWRLSLVGALRLIIISNAKTRKKKKNSKGGKLRFPTHLIHARNEMMLWKGNFAISFQFLVRKRSCYKTIRSFLRRNCSVTTQPVSVKKVDITFTVELPEKIVLQPLQAEAICRTDDRTFAKYESFTHQNMSTNNIQEISFN